MTKVPEESLVSPIAYEARVARVNELGLTIVMQRFSPLHTWVGSFVNDWGIAGTITAHFETNTFSWAPARAKALRSIVGHLDELTRVCRRQDPSLSERFRAATTSFDPGTIRFVTVKEPSKT